MSYELILGDCLRAMADMPAASIDLILTDPPYFRVKDEPWDNQWDTRDGFLSWMADLCEQWQRILKPNGSLYVFASPQMAARVEMVVSGRFNILNHIVWAKHDGSGAGTGGHSKVCKEDLRAYFPQTERIIFADQGTADEMADQISGFSDAETALKKRIFGDYLVAEWKRAGVNYHQITEAIGAYRKHNHGGAASNWALGLNVPTPEQYDAMRAYLNGLNCAEYLRQEYEELRQEYEELRRPFNASPDAPYTDVWTFATVGAYPGKHPCEKPLELMAHMIRLSSRPGATVLDCFAGSGVTGEACAKLGCKFIGIEASRLWHSKAKRRVAAAYADWRTAQTAITSIGDATHDDLPLFIMEPTP